MKLRKMKKKLGKKRKVYHFYFLDLKNKIYKIKGVKTDKEKNYS